MNTYAYVICFLLSSVLLFSQENVEIKGVGIGTINPKATLDVEGDIRISKLGDYTEISIPLAWDETTKKIVRGTGDESSTLRPFYTGNYEIRTAKDAVTIKNFDTKIPADRYTVIVTSAEFNKKSGIVYVKYMGEKANINDDVTAIFNYGTFVENGTWRLNADYKSTQPGFSGSDYYWDISILIINNNLIFPFLTRNGTVDTSGNGADIISVIDDK